MPGASCTLPRASLTQGEEVGAPVNPCSLQVAELGLEPGSAAQSHVRSNQSCSSYVRVSCGVPVVTSLSRVEERACMGIPRTEFLPDTEMLQGSRLPFDVRQTLRHSEGQRKGQPGDL